MCTTCEPRGARGGVLSLALDVYTCLRRFGTPVYKLYRFDSYTRTMPPRVRRPNVRLQDLDDVDDARAAAQPAAPRRAPRRQRAAVAQPAVVEVSDEEEEAVIAPPPRRRPPRAPAPRPAPRDDDEEGEEEEDGDVAEAALTNDQLYARIQTAMGPNANRLTYVMFAYKTWRTTLRMYAKVDALQNDGIRIKLGRYFRAINLNLNNGPGEVCDMHQVNATMYTVKIFTTKLRDWNVSVFDHTLPENAWVTVGHRLPDYNQFWLSQHASLARVRTDFLAVLQRHCADTRDAHFRAWLAFPMLRRMHVERRRLGWRERLNPAEFSLLTDPELDTIEFQIPNVFPREMYYNPVNNEYMFELDEIQRFEWEPYDALNDASDAELVRRLEASSYVLTNALTVEMTNVLLEASLLRENIQDQDANDESFIFLDKVFPVGMESAFHWSNAKLTNAAGIARLNEITQYRRMRINAQNALVSDTYATVQAFKAQAFQNWVPLHDLIYNIERSNLLIRPQISTLDSFIGTRVHLRLAAVLCRAPVQGPHVPDWVKLVDTTLFGPSISIQRPMDAAALLEVTNRLAGIAIVPPPAPPGAPAPVRVDPVYVKDGAGSTYIRNQLYEFISADPNDDLSIRRFCTPIEALFRENHPQLGRRATLREWCTFDATDVCDAVILLATEYPIVHPFCMFWHDKHRMFKFYTTQIDFILRATYERTDKAGVIIGEYKTLIENRAPTHRVVNKQTLAQALCNAIVFELQTNIRVRGVLVVYTTRRGTAYAATIDVAAHRNSRAFVDLYNVITMRPNLDGASGLIYYDGACLVSTTAAAAFPNIDIHAPVYAPLPNLVMRHTPTPNARDLDTFPGPNNAPITWWDPARFQVANNEPITSWLRLYHVNARRVSVTLPALLDKLFVAFTWDIGAGPTQRVPGAAPAAIPAAAANVGVRAVFEAEPDSLNTDERVYPSTETANHTNVRLELSSAIVDNITARAQMPYIVVALNDAVRSTQTLAAFWKHMHTMPTFTQGVYRNQRGRSAGVNRMDPIALTNPAPDFDAAETYDARRKLLFQMLVRCAHRYVNVMVAQLTYSGDGTQVIINVQGDDDARLRSQKFVHNSQRAYWEEDLLTFGTDHGAIHAVNEVILWALGFRVGRAR